MSILLMVLLALPGQETPKLEVGQKAPAFGAKNQLSKTIRLSDFAGKKNVLLAFYPMDFTPG